MDELVKKLEELRNKIEELDARLGISAKRVELGKLQAQTTAANFWSDDQAAKKVMQRIAEIEAEIGQVEDLQKRVQDSLDLCEMAALEKEMGLNQEIETAIMRIDQEMAKLTTSLFLSGPYDTGNALLSIHAGQGGTEAMDWAEMLYRMYVRYVERQNWRLEIITETRGEEAGIKEIACLVSGRMAYGFLKREAGTHRLVRQSPFNADNLRQTSFALVEVLPQVDESPDIVVKDEEVEWAFFRAGGHGGQNVNKVNTAVRLKHLPSGIVVEARTERYQEQNRKMAMSLLKGKLWRIQEEKRLQEIDSMKGQKIASWGSQIRSYVLHPYHLVKDNRTGIESTNTEAVLDGELQEFIDSEIKLG